MGIEQLATIQLTHANQDRPVVLRVVDIIHVDKEPNGGAEICLGAATGGWKVKVGETVAQVQAAIKQRWDEARTQGAVQAIRTVTAAYTATTEDFTILADATAGAITVTLPSVADVTGRMYVIKKIDAGGNAVTIDGASSETIDGSATKSCAAQNDVFMIQSNGAAWYVLAAGEAT
jgi:hypothetical protein